MNIKHMNLPIHRRYQWQFVWRDWSCAVYLFLAAIMLVLTMLAGYEYLTEYNLRLSAEDHASDMTLTAWKLAHFGAPGYTHTDMIENTSSIQVRKP